MAKKKNPASVPKPPSSGDLVNMRQDLLKRWGAKVALGEDIRDKDLASISTGSFKLDWALGTPLIEGSLNEIYGTNQTGKTTLALEVSANAIKMNKPVFYFDVERKLRESQLNMIRGLAPDKRNLFTRIRPDTGEEAADMIYDCIMEFPGCLIVFDSISAMMPEIEGTESASTQFMGKVAKLTWRIVRRCLGPAERNKCTLLFLSHISPKLNPYQTGDLVKGGRAIADLSAQRIKLKRLGKDILKDSDGNPYGQMTQCEIIKNNMARPFRKVSIPIIWGKGINKTLDLLQLGRDLGIVEYSKGWYVFQPEEDVEGIRKREADMLTIINTQQPYREKLIKSIKEILG